MKHALRLTGLFLLIASFSPSAFAHDHDGHRLPREDYNRIATLAHELDVRADDFRRDVERSEDFRRNRHVLESVTHFAGQSADFHRRIESYWESPWAIDEEAQHLLEDARRVDDQIRNGGLTSFHSYRDWQRVVPLLEELSAVYRRGNGRDDHDNYRGRDDRDRHDRDRHDRDRDDRDRDDRGRDDRDGDGEHDNRRGYGYR